MGLAHLVLLFCLVCVASSANKLWLEDCEIQCILAADRYTDLWRRYSKYGDMQRRMIKLCDKADRRDQRIPVCDIAVSLVLNNWKIKELLESQKMDSGELSRYCKFGCEIYGPK